MNHEPGSASKDPSHDDTTGDSHDDTTQDLTKDTIEMPEPTAPPQVVPVPEPEPVPEPVPVPDRPAVDPLLLQLETQPVPTAGATAGLPTTLPTYPTLPTAYTLDDRPDDAGPAAPAAVDSAVDGVVDGVVDSAVDGVVVAPRVRRLPRVRTVTFGLVLLAISVLSLVSLLTDVRIDGGVVGLGLLIGAGAALLAGGIAAAVRESRGGPGAAH